MVVALDPLPGRMDLGIVRRIVRELERCALLQVEIAVVAEPDGAREPRPLRDDNARRPRSRTPPSPRRTRPCTSSRRGSRRSPKRGIPFLRNPAPRSCTRRTAPKPSERFPTRLLKSSYYVTMLTMYRRQNQNQNGFSHHVISPTRPCPSERADSRAHRCPSIPR